MQIKINYSSQNGERDKCHFKQKRVQSKDSKSIRMTLQEYLQSTNLKRKLKERSKSRQNSQQKNSKLEQQTNQLQLPAFTNYQTQQYFKLNKQWKAKKSFNLWIQKLKELCRQYIINDSHYIEVIRIIEKMAQFVKSEIQTIKKDNLLLQSYLVTEASYWPAQKSMQDNKSHTKNDCFSNYFKNIKVGNSEYFESPQKSRIQNLKIAQKQEIQQLDQNPEHNRIILNRPLSQSKNGPNNIITNVQNSTTNNCRISSTSTKYQKNTFTKQTFDSNKHRSHHLYSFQDQMSSGVPKIKNSANNSSAHLNIRDFDSDVYKNCNKDQLNIIEQEVPRLSLMSRYDQNKVLQRNNANDTSQISTRTQIQQSSPKKNEKSSIKQKRSLNERNPIPNKDSLQQMDMIFLKIESNQENTKQSLEIKDEQIVNNKKSNEKIRISQFIKSEIKYSPDSPQLQNASKISGPQQQISLQTPSTLKRPYASRNDIQIRNQSHSIIHQNVPCNKLYGQSQNNENKVTSINSIKSSKEDIMKRYENYRKQQSKKRK